MQLRNNSGMRIRFLAVPVALALILSACLPDLPGPEAAVEVTVTPADAALVAMDWSISGQPTHRDGPREWEGTCAAGCATFEQTILAGQYELRVTPPPFAANDLNHGWVATGASAEVTADYVHDFNILMQTSRAFTAEFRRPHVLSWEYEASAAGVSPAAVTLLGVTSEGPDFDLAGVTVRCGWAGSDGSMDFVMPDGEPVTLSSTARDIQLVYSGDVPNPAFPNSAPSCNIDLAFDTDNRPVAHVFRVTTAAD